MNTLTISKKITKGEELVIISRKEYEDFLEFYAMKTKKNNEINLTPLQRKRLNKARKNLIKGRVLTIHELKRKLDIKS